MIEAKQQLVKEDFHWYWWLEGWENEHSSSNFSNDAISLGSHICRFEDALDLLGSQHQALPPYQQCVFHEEVLMLSQSNFEIFDPSQVKSRG